MAKLRSGAIIVDLTGGGVYGDIQHCELADLLESAQALVDLAPRLKHKGLLGFHKDFDVGCWVMTHNTQFVVHKGLVLEADISRGAAGMPYTQRPIHLTASRMSATMEEYITANWYELLVGSVRDGKVTPNVDGIVDLGAPARAKHETQEREWQRKQAKIPKQLTLLGEE